MTPPSDKTDSTRTHRTRSVDIVSRTRGGAWLQLALAIVLLSGTVDRSLAQTLDVEELAAPRTAAAIRDAVDAVGRAQMDIDTRAARDQSIALLETIAGLDWSERRWYLPEAELALRWLRRIGFELGDFTGITPVFESWARSGEDAPAGDASDVAAVATFCAGVARIVTPRDGRDPAEYWERLGYLRRWRIVGPFDNERGGGMNVAHGPEQPVEGEPLESFKGKKRQVAWRHLPVRPRVGLIDFETLMRPSEQVLAYAFTRVRCESDLDASLRIDSSSPYRVWINGELVASRDARRPIAFGQDAVALSLRAGWNTVLVKSGIELGDWKMRVRIASPGGGPLGGWEEPGVDEGEPLRQLPKPPTGGDEASERLEPTSLRTLAQRREAHPEDDASAEFVRAALLRERRPFDFTEHPDREALSRAILLRADPVPSYYHYRLAQAHLRSIGVQADRDENAWRQSLERAAGSEPPSLRALVDLGDYYLDTFGNTVKAESYARRALDVKPDHAAARMLLARVHERRGFPDATERTLDQLASEGVRESSIERYLVHTAERSGDLERAIRRLRTRLERHALDTGARLHLARLLAARGDVDTAVTVVRAGLDALPYDASLRAHIVRLERGRQRLDAALQTQRELITLTPDEADHHRTAGDLLRLLGQPEAARQAYAEALAIQPNSPALRDYVEFLDQRREPFVEQNRRDVSELVEAALAEEPGGDDAVETLLTLTSVELHADGTTREFHQEVLRVGNEQGMRQLDRHRSFYARGDQRLEYKLARVVHADGTVDHARLDSFSGGARGSGTYATASINLPPLDVGDIVEVQYLVEDLHPSFFGDYFGRREFFQSTTPIREKLFRLRAPADRELHFHYRNLDLTPAVERDPAGGEVVYTWRRTDIAKLRPEPGMPALSETAPLLEISTFESWDAFSRWYWNLIHEQFEMSPEIRAKVRELTSGLTSDDERLRAIYNYVVQEVRYNAWEFGVHGFKPYNAPAIFARSFGDCKDKATLMTVMLDEVGITAYPVLIYATRERSEEDLSLPMVHHFNHCITYVPPDGDRPGLYLDGTAQHNRIEELPTSDRGATVLIVRPDGGSLATIPWNTPQQNSVTQSVRVDLRADSSAILDLRGEAVGDYGAVLRRTFEIPGNRQRTLERIFGARYPGVKVLQQEFSSLEELVAPVSFHFRLEVPQLATRTPSGVAMDPVDDFFNSAQLLENAASLETRQFDLLLGAPLAATLEVDLRLPPELEVKSLPRQLSRENRFGTFRVSHEVRPDGVSFRRVLITAAPRVELSEYDAFRSLATELKQHLQEKWLFTEEDAGR